MNGPSVAPIPKLGWLVTIFGSSVARRFTHIMPTIAVYTGRNRRGRVVATTAKLPVRIPALPIPVTARPTINTTEVGAVAHITVPVSKMTIANTYDHFTE